MAIALRCCALTARCRAPLRRAGSGGAAAADAVRASSGMTNGISWFSTREYKNMVVPDRLGRWGSCEVLALGTAGTFPTARRGAPCTVVRGQDETYVGFVRCIGGRVQV